MVLKNQFSIVAVLIMLLGSMYSCKNVENNKAEWAEENESEQDGMEKATRQEFLMTRDPILNDIPRERLEAARIKMETLQSPASRVTALAWQERGPSNVGGRTRAILVDKNDATGNTVFAGSVGGGIFKTTNFTSTSVSWVPVDDKLNNLAITALVQDNANPLIMYAGTGEGWFNVDAIRGGGIYKSTNGGTTWTLLSSTSLFEFVQDMVIDNNGNVYAALRNQTSVNRGVHRSTNGGTTWTQVLGAPLPGFAISRAADLEVASNGDVYATLGIFQRSLIMKSSFATNGANTGALNTWQDITPLHTTITQRAEIAVAPSNPQRLYLIMQDSANSQVSTLYRSNNAGTTWDSLPAPSILNNAAASQTWFNLIAAVDPTNADVLILGGYLLAKSTDAGTNFFNLSSLNFHVDQHMLIFIGASRLIAGNDGGVFYSDNANTTSPTFQNKNNGYNVTQFYGCDYHPTNANYFLAGAQDNNTQKFTAAGINATTFVTGGDGGIPHIDQTDGLIQISSATNNNFYRSTNGGSTFSALSSVSNNRGVFINPSDYDDVQNILYVGEDPGQYYVISGLDATPAGAIKTLPAIGAREITAVKVDPFVTNTVWLGASLGSVVPQVLKISNANTTPVIQATGTLPGAPANSSISCIDVDPANANHILVTLSNYGIPSVYESTDGAFTFTNVESNLPDMPVRWALFVPATSQLNGTTGGNGGILLATELGVWSTSTTSGTTTAWIPNNGGLPNVRTDMIKYNPQNNTVVAATHGRGLYTTVLPSTATGVNTVLNTKDFIGYISATQQQLFIKPGNLTGVKNITVNLFDMSGKMVMSNKTSYGNATMNISQLSSGSYVVKIYGDKKETYTQQFVK